MRIIMSQIQDSRGTGLDRGTSRPGKRGWAIIVLPAPSVAPTWVFGYKIEVLAKAEHILDLGKNLLKAVK